MNTGAGHVFIVRGDLLHFACDAIVVPTDHAGRIELPWAEHLRNLGLEVVTDPAGGARLGPADRELIGGPVGSDNGLPTTWLLATATSAPGSRDEVAGVTGRQDVEGLARTLMVFAEKFAERRQGGEPLSGRSCPLVAMPLLGSGAGGFGQRLRQYAPELLSTLRQTAVAGHFDIALIIFGDDRAEVHDALLRRERERLGFTMDARDLAERWELGPSRPASTTAVLDVIRRLLERAADGQLVPFFGAGVSVAAGAQSWTGLLDELDAAAREQDDTSSEPLPNLEELDPYDRAQIYHRLLGAEAFDDRIREALTIAAPSLQHHLLAALRSRDAVTTNFDTAYEQAVRGAKLGEVAVIPASAGEFRLLKLHGSMPSGIDAASAPLASSPWLPPVFTRDQVLDHRAYGGPLRGSLQMMLLTGHVAFIGYSLRDKHLHEAIHQVRQIREQAAGRGRSAGALATAIQAQAAPEVSLSWGPDVDVIWPRVVGPGGASAGGIAARELEILLDALADAASLSEIPVLAFRDDELDEHELAVKRSLRSLSKALPEAGRPAAIQRLLWSFGARDAPSDG